MSQIKLTEHYAQSLVAHHFNYRANLVLPNISWSIDLHECDVLVVRPSGWAVEIEIKISYYDLKADFKKRHGHRSNKISELYYAVPANIQEKALELIPEDCGLLVFVPYSYYHTLYYKVRLIRKAKKRPDSRKLTDTEIHKLYSVGCMRLWPIKYSYRKKREKIIHEYPSLFNSTL